MKILILTTETTHHTWYVRELIKFYPNTRAIIETTSHPAPIETHHPLETTRNEFELQHLLQNENTKISQLVPSLEVQNINDEAALKYVNEYGPDIIVVFGTRKIKAPFVLQYKDKIINLHGGDPELYRGLDSHYWAIYHDDFKALTTTLHHLNENLDDGNIILRSELDPKKISNLYELRALNTRTCLELTLTALKMFESLGYFTSYKQKTLGRYYSFMPTVLKDICFKKFEKYINAARS